MTRAALIPQARRHDEIVLALPVAHIYGFTLLVGAACAGVPTYFLDRFRPTDVLDALESRRASVFAGVPAMYRMLEEAGADDRDLRSVRLWISGADAMPDELVTRFKRRGRPPRSLRRLDRRGDVRRGLRHGRDGRRRGHQGLAPLLPASFGGSLGMALPGVKMKVVDEAGEEVAVGSVGELWLSGPSILKGYHGAPEATANALTPDGWLRTGDLARRGPLRAINFEGRMKDVIKRGGYSVYAVEVEQALEEHPSIVEAAVVPVPDERDGEVPVAAVRLTKGAVLDDLDLEAWASQHLSRYKVPVRFVAFDEFPRTGTDKIQRREVIALVS